MQPAFQSFFFRTDGVTMDARWILSFILIILTKKHDVAAHECSTSESVACRSEIQDLRQDKSRYYYATDNQTLVEMCRKQVLAVNCVNSFAEECLSEEEQAYFKKLILGSDKFLDTFCFEDSRLRKSYLLHSPCIRNISTKLDGCTQRYQASQKELDLLVDDNNILLKNTCCIYFKNIQCSSNATLDACGKDAAELVSELLTLLSGTYLTSRCEPYVYYDPESCILLSSSVIFVPNIIVLWTLIFISCVLSYT